jgi:hypothetical protein
MTPKEKAEDLLSKYYFQVQTLDKQKQCALIAVDQIILEQCKSSELKDARYQDERIHYWQEVKQEIEKL